jgi:hypothetical protein
VRGGPDFTLAGVGLRLDHRAPEIMGRAPCRHWVRSPFTGRSDITGRPGAQNFYPDILRLELTNFSGEGQTVLNGADPNSATRFFESEGLDFRTAGQFRLNRSTIAQQPQATGAASTTEGNSMADEVGTSTVVNTTDRRLNAAADVIETGNHTPGALAIQADFHLYKEAQQLTTINGSDLVEVRGPTKDSGTTIRIFDVGKARTANLSVTAGLSTDVVYSLATSGSAFTATLQIIDWTDSDNRKVVASLLTTVPGTASVTRTLSFTPKTGKTYRAHIHNTGHAGGGDADDPATGGYIVVNTVTYGKADEPATVTVIAYNESGAATVTSKQIQVTSTATAKVASLTFTAAGATNYRYKVRYDSGNQRPVADKVVQTVAAAAAFTFDALELGQGGRVWLAGHAAAVDSQTWFYDFTNEDWDTGPALNAVATANETIYALAHSDTFEYALVSGGEVFRFTTSADTQHTAAITEAVSIAVAQDRLFVLSEGTTNGTVVATYPLDSGTPATQLATVTVGTAKPTSSVTYRQRMCGTPSGARFFQNYSDIHAVVWEVDSAGQSLVARQVAVMDVGTKITAIEYSQGYTFLVGQSIAETGEVARSSLWAIPPNGNVAERIGEFREGVEDAPVYIQPYQNDLWILQGDRVWRYSLRTGGLFHEYQLNPTTSANAKALAVVRAHTFAAFSDEGVHVTGALGTYRQSSVADGNSYTSSTYDFDLPGVLKELNEITVLTDELPASTALQVEIQKDQDGDWLTLGSSTSGSKHPFRVTAADIVPTVQTIQVRTTLSSQTGANTPTVKGVVVTAWTAEEEEFWDLVVRLDDEDSSDRIAGHQRQGKHIADEVWAAKQTKEPVNLIDHMEGHEYLVRVEDIDDQRDVSPEHEGRMAIRLRVLS